MADMKAFFASIPQFFVLLWASVVRLFVSKGSAQDHETDDIESGISSPSMTKNESDLSETAIDIRREKIILLPATSAESATESNLKHSPTISYDHPSRRPSRRVSAVDPVKSRIVDATLKQVQDRNINVVKSVVVTPCAVIAVPCTAKIEYYDPGADLCDAVLGTTKTRTKRRARGIQFVHTPTVIEDHPQADLLEGKDKISVRRGGSIEDLCDLFPLPPTRITSPPGGIRVLFESTIQRCSRAVKICPALIVTQSSPYNSDAESMRSMNSFGSDSDDTLELSPYGSTKFLSPEAAFYNDLTPSSAEVSIWPEEMSPEDDLIQEIEAIEASEALRSAGPASDYASQGLIITHSSHNIAALSIHIAQDTQESAPRASVFASDSKGLVERYHNVVDRFTEADLQKGDIADETCRKRKGTAAALAQADTILRELLTTSPSEDAIVDCLLEQLETSFEFDEEGRDSLAWIAERGALSEEIKARLHKHISLQSCKRKSVYLTVEKNANERPLSSDWEASIEKILQSFREIEAEDLDFRDLFYRDSSFFSQSSLAPNLQELKEESGGRLDSSQDRAYDDSFESVEKSMGFGEILSLFEVGRDKAMVKAEDSACVSLSGLAAVINIKNIDQEEMKADANAIMADDSEVSSSGDESAAAPYIWMTTSTDDDAGDEEKDGEDDQWSDLLELDEYIG